MIFDIHPGDNLYATLATLHAGDEVVVHDGTYTSPGFVEVTWPGTASQPIVVHAAPGEHPILAGTFAQNNLNIIGSYWTLEGFEITGGGHGLRLKGVDHATIQDNKLHALGDVGISCNFEPMSCDSVQIIHNEIYDTGKDTANGATGEGMYLGCNSAACLFTNGFISNNWVHDTGGSQGDGIEVKEGAHDNVVRDNVIIRTPYPGITMYGFAGAGGPNIVERNLVWHTMDNGIQIVGQIVVRNNIVLDAPASGIASKPSQGSTPHDAQIINNTVVSPSSCLKTNSWSTETGNVIANNALYCSAGAAIDLTGGANADVTIAGNVGLGTSSAASGFAMGVSIAADLGDPSTGNVYPPPGSALFNAADPAHLPADDFNVIARILHTAGAYDGVNPNTGWIVVEGFKTVPEQPVDGPSGDGTPIDCIGSPDCPTPKSDSGCGCAGSDDPSGVLALVAWLTWSSGRWTSRFRRRRSRRPGPR